MRIRRRRALTHAQLMRRELGEGMDHMRLAAVHAAGGMGAAVSPAMGRVRGAAADAAVATVAPLATVARDGARQARKAQMKMMRKQTRTASRSRWPRLAGLLATGAAVGAGVAYVRRRRQQHQWEEYDSGTGLTSAPSATGSMVDSATDTTADALRTGGDKASAMAERAADKVERAGDKTADTADDLASRSATSSRNSRT